MAARRPDWLSQLSPGAWVILLLALGSSALVAWLPRDARGGMPLWIFATTHRDTYTPLVEQWNREHPEKRVDLKLIQFQALERRMLSGFMSGTPVGDLIETERVVAARSFAGPLDRVGFVDLTDRLRDEGLLDAIVAPSFTLWTSRGRIFGIPHDVHPVLLGYRADLVEAAGIDVSGIETWEDYFRTMRPLLRDLDGDGRIDRYLLGGWSTVPHFVEMMLLQAGGRLFDENERPCLDLERNAFVLATLTTWFAGPQRVCAEAPEFSASGHKLRLDGLVVGSLLPDWMIGVWKREIPALAGKVKLMPVPAWEKGGRRTTVWGGTMLGIARAAPDFEAAWAFAKHLYLAPELADALFEGVGIVTPVKAHWTRPIFHRPDPYFSGQAIGTLYIAHAPEVPPRPASSYNTFALEQIVGVTVGLHAYAQRERRFTVPELLPEARRRLAEAQAVVERQVARNRFLQP